MDVPPRSKILIADDDLVVLKVLSLKFSSVGFDVVKVHDGGQVARTVAEARPDVVLLDLDFGASGEYGHVTWDGLKILDWLGRIEDVATIPIIVLTANESEAVHLDCRNSGAAAVLQKPVDFETLLAQIRRLTGIP
jgi:CheY-like chemotaxis protein